MPAGVVSRGCMNRRVASGVIPARWKAAAEQPKTLAAWPAWSEPGQLPTGAGVASSRGDLHTAAAEITETVIPLGDEDGIGLEGVRLRINAWAFKRMHEVTATLEVTGGRSFVTISRLDGWPSARHMNLQARKHASLKHLPTVVEHCHVHRFGDNALLGLEAFVPGNLPVAAPLEAPLTSFRQFLRTVGQEFGISGIEDFDPPPWQEFLL